MLNLKGLDYDYVPVNLLKGEQKEDHYYALNPAKQVPTLKMNGLTLTESLPIAELLEEIEPEPRLLSDDPIKRYQIRRLCEVINSGT